MLIDSKGITAPLSLTNTIHLKHAPVVTCRRQAGVGLVEILITLIVVSIGFLAAGRMQVQGIRNTQTAYVSSQAGFLVKDMTDRMRANIKGVEDGHYDDIDTKAAGNAGAPTCAGQGASGESCSPAEIAQLDIAEWSTYITSPGDGSTIPVIPSGDTINAGGKVVKVDDFYRVTMTWSEVVGGTESEQSLVMDIVP